MLGVVLAGGEGVRLRPLVKRTPKALVRLAGRPLYVYSLEELSPVTRRVVVVAPPGRGGLFREAPRVVEQPLVGNLDSAIAVARAESEREDAETVVLAFTGFISAPRGMASAVVDYYSTSGYQAVLAAVPVATGLETYGFLDMSPSGSVSAYIPPGSAKARAGAGYVFAGVLAASRAALRVLASHGFEEGLNRLAGEGVLGALVWHGDWVEIGYPWDLLEAKRIALQLAQPTIHPEASIGRGATLEGRVTVERGARISSGAVVEGPAYIGPGALVEAGAYISSSILEASARLGSHASVVESVVMESASIGPHSHVEHSVVGPSASLGHYTLARAGEPPTPPARLAGLEKILKIKTVVGAIVGEAARLPPRSTLDPGVIAE